MSRIRITDALVTRTTPRPGSRVYLWDTEVPRLGLLVYPSGAKAWIVQYYHAGRDVRVNLGHPPTIDVKEARRKAQEALVDTREQLSRASGFKASRTFLEASQAYLEERLKEKQSYRRTTDLLTRVTPRWFQALPLTDVGAEQLREVHASLAHIPGQANNVVGAVRTVMNFAVSKRWVPSNTLASRMDLYPRQRRKKALETEQYRLLLETIRQRFEEEDRLQWLALEAVVLSGGRKGEILGLLESEVDRRSMIIRKVHHKTAAKTGAKEIPITPQFLEVLDRVDAWKQRRIAEGDREPAIAKRCAESPYVFPAPGRREGQHGFLANIDDDAKALFRHLASLSLIPEGFVIHNLRSAFISMAMQRGVDVSVVAKFVGHSDVQTTLKHYREVTGEEVQKGRNVMQSFFSEISE
jgi:integrase